MFLLVSANSMTLTLSTFRKPAQSRSPLTYFIFLIILLSPASADWVKMRKMKNLTKSLVSILSLYPKNFKVVYPKSFRLVIDKNMEISSNIKTQCLHMTIVFGGVLDNLS